MSEEKVEVTESCPICYSRTTFSSEPKPCDNCNVPLVAWMPLFKLTESGFMLRLSEDVRKDLMEKYVIP